MTSPGPPTHWAAWHRAYADPTSALSARLDAVVAQVRAALDRRSPGQVRLISACAGQGHDVLAALEHHPRRADVVGRLVEADPHNAHAARRALAAAGHGGLESVHGDASTTDAYVGIAPADVVLLCGIFGNVPDDDVRTTVTLAPMLCAAGATVIWTRHRAAPDLTPTIRGWFAASGFTEVAFESPGPSAWAVGVHRLVRAPTPLREGLRMFTFTR